MLKEFRNQIQDYKRGKISASQFHVPLGAFFGVYPLRSSSQYFLRIKIPSGVLTPEKISAIARMMDDYHLRPYIHITTRQAIEVYGIEPSNLLDILCRIDEAGLTSFASGGSSVRCITSCVLGGVSDNEAFDVTPYALEASEYFMNHSHYHSLPRKIKIGFEGCPEDHTFIGIQDIGVQAALDANRDPFFQIYVGGGLSTQPFVAQLLEERTETGRLLATLEAVLKVFDQHGNRNDRKHARLKYLVLDLGIEKFRDLVFEERKKNFFVSRDFPQSLNSSRPCEGKPLKKLPSDLKFREWLETNIYWQKQKNFATVFVQCPLGNLPPKSLQALAHIGRKFHAQDIRTTITQNLALRGIHQNLLSALYRALRKNGLISLCPAGQITDITRCASADSCDSAFTSTRGLALALQGMLENSFGTHRSEIKNIRIKISGCPNACAQHSIASIGFHGLARRAGNYLIPSYRMFVGGNPSKGATCFGKLIGTIPARRIPQSVKDILEIFLRERKWNEDFSAFTHRVGSAALQNPLRAYQEYTPLDVVKENLFKDMGSDDIFSLPNLSKHEPD